MSQHEVFSFCEVHYRMVVCGRFSGQMRAGKKVIEKGRIKLFNFLLPVEFLHIDSCTRWGVFGVNM